MSMVVIGGFLITLTYWALQRTVVPRVQAGQPKKKKQKSNMGVGESFNFLAKSPYIRDLATLVSVCDVSMWWTHCSVSDDSVSIAVLLLSCKAPTFSFGQAALMTTCPGGTRKSTA